MAVAARMPPLASNWRRTEHDLLQPAIKDPDAIVSCSLLYAVCGQDDGTREWEGQRAGHRVGNGRQDGATPRWRLAAARVEAGS